MNKEETEKGIRLDQTKKVFESVADAINNGSISYRNLIYDKLGFKGHYDELIVGLTITNAIVDLEEKDKIIDKILTSGCFENECPLSIVFDTPALSQKKIEKMCNCDNCKDTYKKCWLKYFKNKIKEGEIK